MVEDGRVVGVVADDIEVRARAVVVASGGFAQSRELLEQYYPYPLAAGDSLFVVAGPGSRGDHFAFGEQVGSSIAGRDWGLTMPTAYFQRYHHWQAGFPPKSRVYVNSTGRRFMDEDASYAVSGGLMDRQGGPVWASSTRRRASDCRPATRTGMPTASPRRPRPGALCAPIPSPNSPNSWVCPPTL